MKPKFQVILEQAIDEGVQRGYYRAHKHNDAPQPEHIIETIQECVMSSLYEYFDFDNQ